MILVLEKFCFSTFLFSAFFSYIYSCKGATLNLSPPTNPGRKDDGIGGYFFSNAVFNEECLFTFGSSPRPKNKNKNKNLAFFVVFPYGDVKPQNAPTPIHILICFEGSVNDPFLKLLGDLATPEVYASIRSRLIFSLHFIFPLHLFLRS